MISQRVLIAECNLGVLLVVNIAVSVESKATDTSHSALTVVRKWMVTTMAECKYYYDEFCVNDKCPLCADYCPVVDTENVCKWEERIEDNERSR